MFCLERGGLGEWGWSSGRPPAGGADMQGDRVDGELHVQCEPGQEKCHNLEVWLLLKFLLRRGSGLLKAEMGQSLVLRLWSRITGCCAARRPAAVNRGSLSSFAWKTPCSCVLTRAYLFIENMNNQRSDGKLECFLRGCLRQDATMTCKANECFNIKFKIKF